MELKQHSRTEPPAPHSVSRSPLNAGHRVVCGLARGLSNNCGSSRIGSPQSLPRGAGAHRRHPHRRDR
jgi:hypothetical protein